MRTTLSIDDMLLRRGKSTAALQGKTLSEFVEEKLRAGLPDDDYRPPLVSHRRGGVLPGVDLTSNASIANILEEEDLERFHATNRRKRTD